jgi:hypothetical protein
MVAAGLINDQRKLKIASTVIIVSVVYLTYWIHVQYYVYHVIGRVHGPRSIQGNGIYYDENDFAMLFVCAAPFVYYLGTSLNNRMARWVALAIIPLTWNAVFMTASRGALVGIAVVLGAFALRSRNKKVGAVVIVSFIAAFVFEAARANWPPRRSTDITLGAGL